MFLPASFGRKDCSCCPHIGLAYEPIPYCSSCQIWLAMQYNTSLPDLSASRFFFSEDRCWTGVIFICYIPGRRLFGVEFQVCWLSPTYPTILAWPLCSSVWSFCMYSYLVTTCSFCAGIHTTKHVRLLPCASYELSNACLYANHSCTKNGVPAVSGGLCLEVLSL